MTTQIDNFRDGVAAAQAGEFDMAGSLLAEVADQRLSDAQLWLWRAVCAPDAHAAIPLLRRVLELDQDHEVARGALGHLLVAYGLAAVPSSPAEARVHLEEACGLVPQNQQAWLALSDTYDTLPERLLHLRRAAARLPGSAEIQGRLRDVLVRHAITEWRAGHAAAAREALQEATVVAPLDAQVWVGLAHVSERPEAIAALRTALVVSPGHSGALSSLKKALVADATALAGVDADASALRWQEVVDLDAADAEAWFGYAGVAPTAEIRIDCLKRVLKLQPDHAAALAALGPSLDTAPVAPAARSIMVVDDSPTVRRALAVMLEKAGHRVVAMPDGEQALAAIEVEAPHLVFLDITMPKMDGYDVCRSIRRRPALADLPVVMLSGKDGFFDKVRGRMAGATEYITKPFEAPAVLAAVEQYCSK